MNRRRQAGIIILMGLFSIFLTFVTLLGILETNVDYFNVSTPEARDDLIVLDFHEMPLTLAVIIFLYTAPSQIFGFSIMYAQDVLFSPDLKLLRHISYTIYLISVITSLTSDVAFAYGRLFAQERNEVEIMVRLSAVLYVYWNVSLTLGGFILGLGAYWSRSLPRSLCWLGMVGSAISLVLAIVAIDPTTTL